MRAAAGGGAASSLSPHASVVRSRGGRAHGRGVGAAPRKLHEVEEVERGDARRDAVEGHPREEAPLDGELDEPELLEDLQGQTGVGQGVLDEARRVLLEEAQDLARAVAAREGLAFAQDLA